MILHGVRRTEDDGSTSLGDDNENGSLDGGDAMRVTLPLPAAVGFHTFPASRGFLLAVFAAEKFLAFPSFRSSFPYFT